VESGKRGTKSGKWKAGDEDEDEAGDEAGDKAGDEAGDVEDNRQSNTKPKPNYWKGKGK